MPTLALLKPRIRDGWAARPVPFDMRPARTSTRKIARTFSRAAMPTARLLRV